MAKKVAKKSTRRTPTPPTAADFAPQLGKDKHTINDIARLANVSKKTVSRVINESPYVHEETRKRVNEIIKKVGFRPDPQARGLAFRRSYLMGLIYDNPNAPYIINIQEGALAALRRQGYELVVHPCDRNSPEFLTDIRELIGRQKLDGVILVPPISENPALATMLKEIKCPYVRVLSAALDSPDNVVVSMDRQSAAEV
ncbi:MAG TPA: LacI family DNA-binding transcriptional regulator, partial [Steroidobacteraceae bacterium]|nr:LacI family DNA-binding transcriptional regulator [Steroidobacteraceae bacterium]